MDTVERAVRFTMTELKVETLKDKQKEAICSFVNGRDCFVILPTGYGKTQCYVLLPYVFDHLRGKTRSSIPPTSFHRQTIRRETLSQRAHKVVPHYPTPPVFS